MRLIFTYLSLFLFTGFLTAQVQLQKVPQHLQQMQTTNDIKYTGAEILSPVQSDYQSPIVNFRDVEYVIGNTNYDLQTNSTGCNRISVRPDGTIVGVWIQGYNTSNYPDRGTGYNARQSFAWSDAPTERLESVRVGWPNHVFTADGAEVVISHTSDTKLLTLRRSALDMTWSESFIPTNIEPGLLWPRAAVGGEDGQTIHAIAITTPVALSGTIYEGVDGQIVYFRSVDGGSSWDQQDVIIPGLDSMFTVRGNADAYYIDARGNDVAIGIFDGWGDVLLFKSSDNGDSWTKHILNDFPLDKYVIDSGYAYEDLPEYMGQRPDSMSIFSSDSYGNVVIDHNGMAHAFFGRMYLQDDGGEGSTYYPSTDGIAYWNETFGNDSLRIAASALDLNGNDTLDVVVDAAGNAAIANYQASLASMPSAGIDASGNLYLVYSALVEGRVSEDDDAQHYRHVYLTVSEDGGETWNDPVDLITEDNIYEPDLIDFVEAVFPTIARDVDSKVRLIYQQDFRPGLSVRGDEDDPSGNTINYFQFDIEDFLINVKTDALVDAEAFQFKLAPTITSDQTITSFNLTESGETELFLVNMHGQIVKQISSGQMQAGFHQQTISVSDLSQGIYYLMIRNNGSYAAIELVKQ